MCVPMCLCLCEHFSVCFVRRVRLKFSSKSREPSGAHGKLNLLIQYNNRPKDTKRESMNQCCILTMLLNVSTDVPTQTQTHSYTHTHKHITVVTSCCLVTFLDDSTGSNNPHRIWGISAQSLIPVPVYVTVCVYSGYQTVFMAQMESSGVIDSLWCSPAAQVTQR